VRAIECCFDRAPCTAHRAHWYKGASPKARAEPRRLLFWVGEFVASSRVARPTTPLCACCRTATFSQPFGSAVLACTPVASRGGALSTASERRPAFVRLLCVAKGATGLPSHHCRRCRARARGAADARSTRRLRARIPRPRRRRAPPP
jgi:hypothetical protein